MIKKLFVLSFLVVNCLALCDMSPLKEYEKFWEYKSRDKVMMEDFARWWGNENAISRILVRLHILHKEYESVLDVGCGFCVDYYSFKKSCPEIEYLGIDIASSFVSLAQERGCRS